jgi:RNA polymerase sigma-70 factor, ECF subfamily
MDWPAGPDSEWVEALSATGQAVQAARERLHDLLLQAARAELDRRGSAASVLAAAPDDRTAPSAASVALAAITNDLDSYRGEPSFAAWAVKFVIAAVTEEAGRWYWQRTILPSAVPGTTLDISRSGLALVRTSEPPEAGRLARQP